jgi:hypothetical protein
VSSCVSGGFPPSARKMGIVVARVTLACAMGFVVVVSTVRRRCVPCWTSHDPSTDIRRLV